MPSPVWREFQVSSREYVIAARVSSGRRFIDDVVVGVNRDKQRVRIWINRGDDIFSVLSTRPQAALDDDDISAAALAVWLGWEEAVHVLQVSYGQPFFELYPAEPYAMPLIQKLHACELPGWSYCTLGSRGISLIKDFYSFGEFAANAVELTDTGISIYKTCLSDGCGFTAAERMMFIENDLMEAAERLAASSCYEYASEILAMHRTFRRWIFYCACADGMV